MHMHMHVHLHVHVHVRRTDTGGHIPYWGPHAWSVLGTACAPSHRRVQEMPPHGMRQVRPQAALLGSQPSGWPRSLCWRRHCAKP